VALLLVIGSLSPAAAQTSAPGADTALLDDFVRLQDLAFTAGGEAKCAANAEQAERAFHAKYDRRLVRIAEWLQKSFTDEDLKSAQTRVHGIAFERTAPKCPAPDDQIQASEKAYADALAKLELEVANRSSSEESR
jgi:hypothetical protein